MMEAAISKKGLSEEDKERFEQVKLRAKKLGVLDINFSSIDSFGGLECFEQTLDVIEDNKDVLDRNAGEA